MTAQGSDLLKKPEIQAAVQAWQAEVKTRGIANLEHRLDRLDGLERKCWEVIEARAAEVGRDPRATGGKTGLITKRYRIVGVGEESKVLTECVADTALTKEIRALHEQAAKELGQWTEKVELSGGVTVQIVGVDVGAI